MRQNDEAIGTLAVRLARIAGQVQGVRRMIEGGRPYLEITGQISAALGALKQVQLKLLGAHLRSCLPAARKPWQPNKLQERVEEMLLTMANEPCDMETQNEGADYLRLTRSIENHDAIRTRRRKP